MSNLTAEILRKNKCGLFAERNTGAEATEYAIAMLQREGVPYIVAATAIGVVVNSLLEDLAKVLES